MNKVLVFLPMIIKGRVNGGVPKVYLNTITAMSNGGSNVMAAFHAQATAIDAAIVDESVIKKPCKFEVPTLSLDSGGLSMFKLLKKILLLFLSILKLRLSDSRQLDCVLLHDITALPYLFGFKSKEFVVYLHSYRPFNNKVARLLVHCIRLSGKKVKFVCPTHDIASEINSLIPSKTMVCGTPVIDQARFQSYFINGGIGGASLSVANQLTLVYVGRFSPIKNLKDVVRLLALAKVNGVCVNLRVYGEPMDEFQENYKQEVVALVYELGVSSFVEFCGFVADPIEAFKTGDASIIFSDGEAIPMAGLESYLACKPVLGYDVPGVSDLIGENERGEKFKHGDLDLGVLAIKKMMSRLNNGEYVFDRYLADFTIESWRDNFYNFIGEGEK